MRGVGRAGRPHQEPDRRAHDPRRRQVHRLRGLVQEPQRGAVPRRLRPRLQSQLNWVEAEALEQEGGTRAARRRARHPGARRLRLARHARHDEGRRVRARARRPVLRHLLRLPVGDRRVRPQRLRARGRRFDRGRRERAAQGDLQAARPARRRRSRRHDAARPLRVRAGAGLAGAADLRHDAHLTSAIAIASSSTACTSRRSPRRACASRADRPTASSSRSRSCRRIRGSSPCSSTPSSSRGRSSRIRCLPASSRRRYRHKIAAKLEHGRRRRSSRAQADARIASVKPVHDRLRSPIGGGHPLAFIVGPVRHRERGARRSTLALALQEIAARCGVPAHLQGVVRQGQPHVAARRSAARASTRACGCSPT